MDNLNDWKEKGQETIVIPKDGKYRISAHIPVNTEGKRIFVRGEEINSKTDSEFDLVKGDVIIIKDKDDIAQ